MSDKHALESVDSLRKQAERCFRLAFEVADPEVRRVLNAYGHQLLEQSEALPLGPGS